VEGSRGERTPQPVAHELTPNECEESDTCIDLDVVVQLVGGKDTDRKRRARSSASKDRDCYMLGFGTLATSGRWAAPCPTSFKSDTSQC
jgi:hypothetical protein